MVKLGMDLDSITHSGTYTLPDSAPLLPQDLDSITHSGTYTLPDSAPLLPQREGGWIQKLETVDRLAAVCLNEKGEVWVGRKIRWADNYSWEKLK